MLFCVVSLYSRVLSRNTALVRRRDRTIAVRTLVGVADTAPLPFVYSSASPRDFALMFDV